jgi:hypothetical protein
MKKRILALAVVLSIGISSIYANNEERVNQKAVSSFKNDFAQATDVKWESNKEYAKATFKMNDQVMFAYYSEAGSLMAVTRNILSSQLPINLQSSLKKNYKESWISDLFEIDSNEETSYYVTLENAEYSITLKSAGSQGWTIFKKERKTV